MGAAPIWEVDAVEGLQRADAAKDWANFAEKWPTFQLAIQETVLQSEPVKFLCRFGFRDLIEALEKIEQTLMVMLLVKTLTPSERLELAVESESARVQFCCAYSVLERGGLRRSLDHDEVSLLVHLLTKVGANPEQWVAWMHAFNRYPIRYRALQTGLGRALGELPSEAITPYVDSIELHCSLASKSDDNRGTVAECLRAFRENAPIERRRQLWKIAYDRWADWGFVDQQLGTSLHEIGRSPLDYAVVGYGVECMNESQRNDTVLALGREMMSLDNTWHRSETDCVTAWNRLLSRFQPYAHAATIAESGADFLAERETYWPFDRSQNPYLCMMFQIASR